MTDREAAFEDWLKTVVNLNPTPIQIEWCRLMWRHLWDFHQKIKQGNV